MGLDVHKESIAVAVAEAGRAPAAYCDEIANRPAAVGELAERLARAHGGELIQFCYEVGPCSYEVHRQLMGMGFDCEVVAPSRIPKAPGERIKTDRRDAVKLARLSRGGELTPVWVPDEDREAMRDLVRARSDFKRAERKAAAASGEAKAISWKAQRRLCGRYRRLIESGKNSKQANVAASRELNGFVWDIVRREMARIPPASGSPRADADATGVG